MIKTIVLLILGVIVIAMVVDRLRKKQEKARFEEIQRRLPAVDETGPTQTGKFRVQQMLQRTEPKSNSEQSALEKVLDEDAPLPDPFAGSKNKQ